MISRVLLRRTLVLPMLCAALAACSDDKDGTGTGSGSFKLGTPAVAQVSLQAGQATTVSIPVTVTGNMRAVTLRADSVPAGFRVGFEPATVTPGITVVTMAISADPTITAKSGTVKIIAEAEGMEDQVARVTVTSTLAPSYTIRSQKDTFSLAVGSTRTLTVDITRDAAFGAKPLDFMIDGLPPGVTATTQTSVTGNQVTLTLTTAADAPERVTTATLRSTNPSFGDRTISVPVQVLRPRGVSISTVTTSLTARQGNHPFMQFTVTREGLFNDPVVVKLENLPAGVTADSVVVPGGLSAASLPQTQTFNVQLHVDPAAATAAATTVTARLSGATAAATLPTPGSKTSTTAVTIGAQTGTLVPLNTNFNVPASAAGAALIYRFDLPAGSTLVSVTLSGFTGDYDIYTARTPSTGTLQRICAAETGSVPETCTPASQPPKPGTYYVVVLAYTASGAGVLKVNTTTP